MTEQKDIRWKQRFKNFEKAYLSLVESQEALESEPDNDFIQDSLIQRYEYTLELAWKTMKDYLENEGFMDVTSPKKAVRKAFQARIIQDGSAWMIALDDRNKTSHAYDEKMAKEVIQSITEQHIPIFRDFYLYMKKETDE
jgi:nucleotidyltransferase substrate binding protein (TIGR01987 family)